MAPTIILFDSSLVLFYKLGITLKALITMVERLIEDGINGKKERYK